MRGSHPAPLRGCECRSRAARLSVAWKNARSSWACTSSSQSVGGPRAGDTGGGSSGSSRCVRIFRIVPGSRTGSPQQPEVAKSAKARDGFALGKQSERDQPDVTAARWARKRKLLPYPRHELGPRNPRRVVRAGLSMRVTTASCGATVVRMSAGRGVLPLADIPDCQRRDGPPELVVGCKHPVVAMPVLPRRRHEARLVTATGRARLARDSAPSPFCRASDRRSIITCIFEPRATDGVFVPTGDGPPAFLPARPITQADLAALTEKVRRRVVCWFRMQRRPRRQGDLSGDG